MLHRDAEAEHAADQNNRFPLDTRIRLLGGDAARDEDQQRAEHYGERQREDAHGHEHEHTDENRDGERRPFTAGPNFVDLFHRTENAKGIGLVGLGNVFATALDEGRRPNESITWLNLRTTLTP